MKWFVKTENQNGKGMLLSVEQWKWLGKMLGGNESYTNSVSDHSYITLSRLSDVQDSYLLSYNNNIDVEIHRYSHISIYDISILHTLWNLWATEQKRNKFVDWVKESNELDRILQGNHPSN